MLMPLTHIYTPMLMPPSMLGTEDAKDTSDNKFELKKGKPSVVMFVGLQVRQAGRRRLQGWSHRG